jgi:VWFA-related protein
VPSSPRDQLFTLTHNVNFVLVPVTVKNSSGELVEGLTPKDFSIYEDGVRQNITFFTSDPFPLSAAIVLDRGLPDSTWKQIRDTLSALVGAFGQFDEISVFTYSNTIRKLQDLTGVNADVVTTSVRKLKYESQPGPGNGVPVALGPFSPSASPNTAGPPNPPPPIIATPNESHVLNDAILAAANELSQRGPTRRKIIFVVSDGREFGSTNNYEDVRRVLLSQQITVYAVGIGDAAIPVYRRLRKVHIPGRGYEDILPKYVSATGGQVFSELTQHAIEQAYSRVTEEARNQYSIGYNTALRPGAGYRSIEVRVHSPNLKIYARDGYYPLPPGK